MTETINRIITLMKKNGDNAHSLEIKAKLPISSITAWKNDKFKPSMDSIIKLARYFNVSADYLLCLTDEPTPIKRLEITERPSYSLIELDKLLDDKRCLDIMKVYAGAPSDDAKSFLKSAFIQIAKNAGMDTVPLIGY